MIYYLCAYCIIAILVSYKLTYFNRFVGYFKEIFDILKSEKELFVLAILFPIMLIITILLIPIFIFMIVFSPITHITKLLYNKTYDLLIKFGRVTKRKSRKKSEEVIPTSIQFKIYRIKVPTLKFKPHHNHIIYIEDEYNILINNYIKDNLEKIQTLFKQNNCVFTYFPNTIITNEVSIIEYFSPFINEDSKQQLSTFWNKLSSKDFYQIICEVLNTPLNKLKPSLLRIYEEESWINGNPTFSLTTFPNVTEENISTLFVEYFKLSFSFILYCSKPPKENDKIIFNPDYADDRFDFEILNIAEDVKNKIMYLKQEGYFELLLQTLGNELVGEMKQFPQLPLLSHLAITDRFEILLPGYNNLEIKMSPLPKAIYILFLRHKNGIRFKMLPAYRKELFSIYSKITTFDSVEQIAESINLVTDPSRNAINEKCSRIRESFIFHFDDYYARNYYITGKRGEEKKVTLPSDLIELPNILNTIPLTNF